MSIGRSWCAVITGVLVALSSALWSFAALHGLSVWVEYAASGLNCADPPARMCPCVEQPFPVSGPDLGVPEHFSRMLSSLGSLLAARLAAPSRLLAFSKPGSCVVV